MEIKCNLKVYNYNSCKPLKQTVSAVIAFVLMPSWLIVFIWSPRKQQHTNHKLSI